MQEFQISRYIKKWLPWIIVLCVAMTIGIFVFLSTHQTYIASAVIHFNGEEAKEGLTPLGTELNVDEIKSSAIMSRVLENLNFGDQIYSVDDLISRIQVTEVIDEDEQAAKDAAIENGEEYTYEPTTFIISFQAEYDEGESFARQVLDETLDVYFAEYSEAYINTGSTVNALRDIENSNYDYIEIMELIEESITETVQTLNARSANDTSYRSTTTGKAFSDLASEFYFIQSVGLSRLYSDILEYQITKDKNLLLSNYRERINNYQISNTVEQEELEDVETLIEAYVEKMRQSGNTNITYEYILDDVYERDLIDKYGEVVGEGDQTVTYDKLIYSWRDHSESRDIALVDAAYCSYIIDVFSRCQGIDNGACIQTNTTCTQRNNPQYTAKVEEVEEEIAQLVSTLEKLYRQVDETNAEYNEYVGAYNISVLSTVAVDESLNVWLYTIIAAVFLLIVCCCGAVLIGRMDDIVQYVFYTDHMTGLKNRASFDAYLLGNSRRLLDKRTAIATVNICNQVEINRKCGREEGDHLIRFVADQLKEEFIKASAMLVYNGNAHFIIVADKMDRSDMEYILEHFRLAMDKRDILTEQEIVYEIGLAETESNDVYRIRGLLSKAYEAQKTYVAAKAE